MIHLHNMDCMEAMAQMPDNAFDLAIVDPPYGILNKTKRGKERSEHLYGKKTKHWDYKPSKKYFEELKRVSKNQIIWGYNHFANVLPVTNSLIVWDKKNPLPTFSDGEVAYTSFTKYGIRIFRYTYHGSICHKESKRIHPTQKPIALYTWILNKYAQKGWRILDTHLGSGSSAIAAYNAGYEFVGYEIDKDYYTAAKKRFENHKRQLRMFV